MICKQTINITVEVHYVHNICVKLLQFESTNTAKALQYYCITLRAYVASCASSYQFQCRMGLCLRRDVYCNGTVECPDGSDEPPNCHRKLLWSKEIIAVFFAFAALHTCQSFLFALCAVSYKYFSL